MKDLIENIQKKSKKQRLLFFWIAIVISVGFAVALWIFLPGNSAPQEPVAENTNDIYNEEVGFPELKQAALDFFREGKNLIVDTKEKVGESLDQTQKLLEKAEQSQNETQPWTPDTTGVAPETAGDTLTETPPAETVSPGTTTNTTPNN